LQDIIIVDSLLAIHIYIERESTFVLQSLSHLHTILKTWNDYKTTG